ncbi:MAG: PAS domain S-box protein [Bacteroidota bacterium]|nr:PAS domain S-box protein [Bacteroidota bacterium]
MKFKLTTEKTLKTGITLLLLFIITVIVLSASPPKQVNSAAKRIVHIHKIQVHAKKLPALVPGIESGSGTYILTGNKTPLEPPEKWQKEMDNKPALLKTLARANLAKQNWIDSLSFYADKSIAFSHHTLSVPGLNGANAATAIVETGKRELYTDRIRLFADKLQGAENVLLVPCQEANKGIKGRLSSFPLTLTVGVFVLIGIGLLLSRFQFLSQKKRKSGLAKQDRFKTAEVSSFFERITDAFVALDTDWRFTYINKKAGEIFERDPGKMIGKHIWTEFPQSIDHPFYKASHLAIKEQQYIHIEEYYPLYDRWFENHIYPSPDGLSVFFREITTKKKAEFALKESEEKYRILFERNLAGIFRSTPAGKIISCNDAYARILGYPSPTEILQTDANLLYFSTTYRDEFIILLREKGEVTNMELVMKHKAGMPVYVIENCVLYKDSKTGEEFIDGVMVDITERKKMEDELFKSKLIIEESESKFKAITNQATEGIALADTDGNYKFVNPAFCIMTGYSEEELLRMAVFDLTAKTQPGSVFFDSKGEKQRLPVEVNLRRKDGSEFMTEIIGTVIKIGGQEFVLGTVRDITERKLAEEKILKSEEQYKDLVENITDLICTHDLDGLVLSVNRAAEEIMGHTFNPLEKMNIRDILAPEFKNDFDLYIGEIRKNGHAQGLMKVRTRSGEIRIWEYNNSLKTTGVKMPVVRGYARDITERKKAEMALIESKRQLESAIKASNTGLWDWNLTTNKVYFSPEWKKQIGYEDDEISDDFSEWQNRVHPDDLKDALAAVNRFIKDPWPNFENIFRFRHKDGSYRWILARASLIADKDGRFYRMLGSHIDITDRKKAEEELNESSEKIKKIVSNVHVGILLQGPRAEILFSNETALTMLGLTEDQLLGKTSFDADWSVVHEDGTPFPGPDHPVPQAIAKKEPVKDVVMGVYRPRTKDRVWLLVNAIPESDAEGNVREVICTFNDITERKKAEEIIIKANRLYFFISQINRMIVRTTDETMLFKEACRIAVEAGQFRMAWIGMIDEATKNIIPVMHAGEEAGYLSKIKVISLNNLPEGRGPTGTALREGKYIVCNDIENDPQMAPWKEAALGRGYLSSIALPIKKTGKVIGAFSFYASEKNFFDTEEIALLEEATGNVAFALENFEKEALRKKAEEKIKTTTEQLRQLTAHLQGIREEERKRIGREIHDELGQQLTAIKMDVAWIDKRTTDETSAIKSKLKNIITLLDGSNQSVRKILSELRPSLLDTYGLPEALEWQSRQFTENTDIPVAFTTTGTDLKLPGEITTCIFRVYQESLTNIMRYSQASKVLTSLSIRGGNIILTVEDDGKGFDPVSIPYKKSFGILGMKERVLSLNGKFELVTSPGKGTKIIISIPYKMK